MEKALEIILIATVGLITASAVIFLIQGESGNYTNFLENQQQNAQENMDCQLKYQEYESRLREVTDGDMCRTDGSDTEVGRWKPNGGKISIDIPDECNPDEWRTRVC